MGKKPTIKHLLSYGWKYFMHIPVETHPPGSKLQLRATKSSFIDYRESNKILQIYIPLKHKVVLFHHVICPNLGKAWQLPLVISPDEELLQQSTPGCTNQEISDLPIKPSPPHSPPTNPKVSNTPETSSQLPSGNSEDNEATP
jgi:hypothetical protein